MIGPLVYALCALTCVGCAALLWRAYARTQMRLLFWSALCFAIMAVSNGLLFVDLALVPGISLLAARNLISQVAYLTLLYGLVFETK
jgi:hypothetical protein